jgi:hypothetical protein
MKYEIRALSFGEILDTSFAILRNHFALLVGAAATMYLPVEIFSAVLLPDTAQTSAEDMASLLTWLGLTLVYLSAVWPVVTASLAYAIGQLYRGNEIGIGEALAHGWKLFLPLSATAVLAYTLTLFGIVLLILPGIYLMVVWMQWTNVAVLENTFGYAALRRSSELVRGYRLRSLGLLIVITIVLSVLSAAVTFTIGFIPVVGTLANALVQSVGGAFGSAALVVMYFDLRCRKEQFDIEHLASLVSATPVESAPALP